MSITRIPCPGNLMIVIDPETLAALYERLLKGETWKSLGAVAGCTETGLKRCFMRAGYDLRIRALRKGSIGKTRNICKTTITNSAAIKLLSMSLRAGN